MKNTTTAVLTFSLVLITGHLSRAGSATWSHHPRSRAPVWQDSDNWIPNTVPDGPDDTATFETSTAEDVFITPGGLEVNGIVFAAGATAFSIHADQGDFTISGVGITNNSGITETLNVDGEFRTISFSNTATAGNSDTLFIGFGTTKFLDSSNAGSSTFDYLGDVQFFGSSSAGTGTFTMRGDNSTYQGSVAFFDSATAANGTFVNEGGTFSGKPGGNVFFFDSSTAGQATFSNENGTGGGFAAVVEFFDSSSADSGTFTNVGGSEGLYGGTIAFFNSSTAGSGTFTSNGGTGFNPAGGSVEFADTSSAADSILIANGGEGPTAGASVTFLNDSTGDLSQVEVFGNGNLDISGHNVPGVTIGSLEGDGVVLLGANILTIGSNALSTAFSGAIKGTGAIAKVGAGTLTLTSGNNYTGTTTVNSGVLLVANTTGSATGTGAVTVDAGTLGGSGVISGAVTVNSGAALAPAVGSKQQVTLTLQDSLTLQAGATYTYTFKARTSQTRADLVVANGVTINGATIKLKAKTQGTLTPDTVLTVISNTSANPISGTFSNLPDGAIVNVNGNNFQASYSGGDGNDLTLTVVP